MKSNVETSSALERLKKLMPSGSAQIQPVYRNAAEWRLWQESEARKHADQLRQQNQKTRAEKIVGRSGIQELHRNCTFANYQVSNDGQRHAISNAKSYAQNFGSGFASFVFSGTPGTGKNHLAAAIGNYLMTKGRSVLIVSVPDLMLRIRACYDAGKSESSLLDELSRVDLLVLDEVGIQRNTPNEKVILNQVIDRRLSGMRPVGVLTNRNHADLCGILGERVMDRLQMDGGMWVNFNWDSYRKNVDHRQMISRGGAR